MFKYERLRIIENLLKENGNVTTSELSEMFNVTEETVRNDLDELQNANKVKRVRGGAYLIEPTDNEVPLTMRTKMMKAEKIKIAELAIQYIKPGETIVLDSSTTANSLAELIKKADLSVTVITNSLVNASILLNAKDVNLIVLGGTLRDKSKSLIGPVTTDSMQKYVVDKAFISCSGLAMPAGPNDTSEPEARIRERMIRASKRVFLLADDTKFDYRTAYLISDFSHIDCIITNERVNSDWEDFLDEQHIKVLF